MRDEVLLERGSRWNPARHAHIAAYGAARTRDDFILKAIFAEPRTVGEMTGNELHVLL